MAGLAPRSWAAADVTAHQTGPVPAQDASRRAAPATSGRHDVEMIGLLVVIVVLLLALTLALGTAPLV